jgi:pyridoxamine 5'-phosphate oxidase
VQGKAALLSSAVANKYFRERPLDAQIISTISKQGQKLESIESLQGAFASFERPINNKNLPRPTDWGCYAIKPVRIEFMEFKESRLHERVLYQLEKDTWTTVLLQP